MTIRFVCNADTHTIFYFQTLGNLRRISNVKVIVEVIILFFIVLLLLFIWKLLRNTFWRKFNEKINFVFPYVKITLMRMSI